MQVYASVTRLVHTDVSATSRPASVPVSLASADCGVIAVYQTSGDSSGLPLAAVDARVTTTSFFYNSFLLGYMSSIRLVPNTLLSFRKNTARIFRSTPSNNIEGRNVRPPVRPSVRPSVHKVSSI